jgi:hypothetical protein
MAQGDYLFNIGHLTSLGTSDVHSNTSTPVMDPGTLAFIKDGFGNKVLMYVSSTATIAQGGLVSKVLNTSAGTITAGTTTSVTTSGLTANVHVGRIFYVTDDAGAAGAAPEGEMSIIRSNSTTNISLEPELPLSAAIAVSDTATMISTYHGVTSAAVVATLVLGVLPGRDGVTANNYAWVVRQGIVKARSSAAAHVIDRAIIAGTGVVAPSSTSAVQLHIGGALAASSSDNAATTVPVYLTLFSPTCPIST